MEKILVIIIKINNLINKYLAKKEKLEESQRDIQNSKINIIHKLNNLMLKIRKY